MDYILPLLSFSLAFLILIFSAGFPLYSRLPWVRKELVKPYKKFRKSYVTSTKPNREFQLSRETRTFLDYYVVKFDRDSLQNLAFEIELRLQIQNDGKHLVNYLTVGLLPLFSLLIASFALFSDLLPPSQLVSVFSFTIIVLIAIVIIVFFDFASKLFVQEPMNKHLIVINKALSLLDDAQLIEPGPISIKSNRHTPSKKKQQKKRA